MASEPVGPEVAVLGTTADDVVVARLNTLLGERWSADDRRRGRWVSLAALGVGDFDAVESVLVRYRVKGWRVSHEQGALGGRPGLRFAT